MAYLIILTGKRVEDVVELNPGATLTVGSDPNSHIQLPGAHVAPMHGQIYPVEGAYYFQDLGQGYTLVNLEPLVNAAHPLRVDDVLVLGRTFVKYVFDKPAALRQIEQSADEMSEKDGEIRRLRERLLAQQGEASKAAKASEALEERAERDAEAIKRLEEAQAAATEQLEKAREGGSSAREEAEQLTADKQATEATLETTKAELEQCRAELGQVGIELAEVQADADEQRLELARAQAEIEESNAEKSEQRAQREAVELDLAEVRAELEELEAEFVRVRTELETELGLVRAELEQTLAAATAEDLAFAVGALSAAREALESLGVPREAPDLPRTAQHDAGALLDGAGLDPELARRVEASLTLWVEQESMRRLSGAAPVFERAPETRDLEQQVHDLRVRSADLAAALVLDGRK